MRHPTATIAAAHVYNVACETQTGAPSRHLLFGMGHGRTTPRNGNVFRVGDVLRSLAPCAAGLLSPGVLLGDILPPLVSSNRVPLRAARVRPGRGKRGEESVAASIIVVVMTIDVAKLSAHPAAKASVTTGVAGGSTIGIADGDVAMSCVELLLLIMNALARFAIIEKQKLAPEN